MQLSPHFSLAEFGLIGCEQRLLDNAAFLCVNVLEPIRAHFGNPITITSGYRDPEHNARVGGVPTSFHLFAGGHSAADIVIYGHTFKEVFDWVRLHSKLPFDKAILEEDATGRTKTLHLQVDRNGTPRRQAFVGVPTPSYHYVMVTVE